MNVHIQDFFSSLRNYLHLTNTVDEMEKMFASTSGKEQMQQTPSDTPAAYRTTVQNPEDFK